MKKNRTRENAVLYGIGHGGIEILAILLHMLMDTFPALYQRGVLPLWSVEVWFVGWTVITVFIAVKLYRELKPYRYG